MRELLAKDETVVFVAEEAPYKAWEYVVTAVAYYFLRTGGVFLNYATNKRVGTVRMHWAGTIRLHMSEQVRMLNHVRTQWPGYHVIYQTKLGVYEGHANAPTKEDRDFVVQALNELIANND